MNAHDLMKKRINGVEVTEQDILESLKEDFNDTIEYLEASSFYHGDYTQQFHNSIKEILLKNKYQPINLDSNFFKNYPVAFFVAKYINPDLRGYRVFPLESITEYKKLIFDILDDDTKANYKLIDAPVTKIIESIVNKQPHTAQEFDYRFRFEELKADDLKKVYDTLIKNKFVFDESNMFFASSIYSPVFILASMKNDREKTIEYMKKNFPNNEGYHWTYDNYKVISDILKSDDIDLSVYDYKLSGETFIYALECDKVGLDATSFNKIFFPLPRKEKFKLIEVVLQIANKQSKAYYRRIIKYGIIRNNEIEGLSKKGKEEFILSVAKLDPTLFPPHMYGYDNQLDIENKYEQKLLTKEEYTILSKMMSDQKYSIELENEALDLLEYTPRPSSLEEAIRVMDKQYKFRDDLTVNELYIFKLYADKLLYHANVEYTHVDMLSYIESKVTRGQHISDEHGNTDIIKIPNGIVESVASLVNVIHHEVNHAIQFKNIKECNVEDDYDIFNYAKDSLLKHCFYNSDYNRISFEYDAEYKAKIQTELLLNDTYNSDISTYEDYLLFSKENDKSISYTKDLNRTSRNIDLDSFLIDEINTLLKKDKEQYKLFLENTILKKYKILTYVYNFTDEGVSLKSNEEIIEGVLKKDEDSSIYLALLQSKINSEDNLNLDKIYKDERLFPVIERIKNAKRGFVKVRMFFNNEMKNLKIRMDQPKRKH